ncbi:hypothetical protein Drose_13895 [Dactylosporangium roseum]|uniref:HEAT repeat domain-containing protein n=1 Tax=Dactylosporangium roseum TaxID=47989 RepID=A0ABY5ZG23_9ACTN|nr:hypothetical protein [Dactylosporangium roseum]UWZ39224.1 hypothetical protein Drose_13895 [Dactylosporangium roseum]
MAALTILRKRGSRIAIRLPFLLLRLNDPVDPVRLQAIAAVRARLTVGHGALLARLLPLIEGLGARRRAARHRRVAHRR